MAPFQSLYAEKDFIQTLKLCNGLSLLHGAAFGRTLSVQVISFKGRAAELAQVSFGNFRPKVA
jgi:hypothetical protein